MRGCTPALAPALALIAALTMAGCSSAPPEPAWKGAAASALAAFSQAYLQGDTRVAELEFGRARAEMTSTGRFDLVAHAELVRCATRVAALESNGCPGFDALAQDASPTGRAYAAYLAGQWQGLDPGLLPEQHRAVLAPGDGSRLAAIADPLSRQVAAGALMAAGRITPSDIGAAIENASHQGWRRPLLMWLGVALARAQAAGDVAESARLQRRIALASK